jgi:uncharacterized protein YndB with AHSA1/START domain
MQPQPTGRLVRKDDGVYLVLDRIVRAPIEEVWAYFSRSGYLQQWIGEFTGTPRTGAVKFRMNAEGDDAEWEDVAIMECAAPHRLHVDVGHAGDSRRMYVHLTEASGHTTVTFGQRMRTLTDEADYGVGWDYYLDRMLAAHDGRPLPRWDDYYPSMLDHYETLCRELSADLKTEHAAAHRDGTLG